ncbi:MAG TPA: Gfo/Idh/MocA family oxidoreductase, partial [Geminicoccaceae bacterium]|nr:Gfo/Idh/MocA family oxidoreductase [Geminicoccaceae bacterium]
MAKPLNVGMIGYGFMARAHSNAWLRAANFFPELTYRPVLKAVAARSADKVKAFADVWGYESTLTDWKALIARADIDLIDICVPNRWHKEIAIAAAEAGKWVACEKPLAMNAAEGEEMVAAIERAGVPNMVWYNYRRVPAIALARRLIDEGRIGRPYHYRARFLQDWTIAPDLPQGGAALWRLDVDAAGSGVTGDLLAHSIDLAIWLNGPITKVMAATETFVKERLHQETGKIQPVGIDDACLVMARFANGSLGLFESTRYARGHKAKMTFELNGETGSIAFDLHDDQWLEFFEYRDSAGH